jgi:DNA-binding NtrC family response regulator
MPPLRERPEDILLIAKHYLNKFSRDNDKAINGITDKAMQALQSYSWPGNIRELINVIERGTILSQHNMMTREELPPHILNYKHGKSSAGEMQTLAKAEKTHIKDSAPR